MQITCSGAGTSGCSWTASSIEEHIAKLDRYIVVPYAVLSSGKLVFCYEGDSITDRVMRQHFEEAAEIGVLITYGGTDAGGYL